MDNLRKLKTANKKAKSMENIEKLKLQTILNPTSHRGWYLLGESYLDIGLNSSGWKCLTTAKKLGSLKAMKRIETILKEYGSKGTEALNQLQGRGGAR